MIAEAHFLLISRQEAEVRSTLLYGGSCSPRDLSAFLSQCQIFIAIFCFLSKEEDETIEADPKNLARLSYSQKKIYDCDIVSSPRTILSLTMLVTLN